TTTNTDHAGYGGLAFVDGFETVGDSVTFLVNTDAAGDYSLNFRYANAENATASRNVYVDGTLVGTLSLPALPNWDSWADAGINTTLTAGPHQVKIAYDASNAVPINLDSLSLVRVTPAAVSVVTQHNNVNRTGANLHEEILNTANVSPEHFGKLFTYPVRGDVFAQPLYVGNVEIPGKGTHNVGYIPTMNN